MASLLQNRYLSKARMDTSNQQLHSLAKSSPSPTESPAATDAHASWAFRWAVEPNQIARPDGLGSVAPACPEVRPWPAAPTPIPWSLFLPPCTIRFVYLPIPFSCAPCDAKHRCRRSIIDCVLGLCWSYNWDSRFSSDFCFRHVQCTTPVGSPLVSSFFVCDIAAATFLCVSQLHIQVAPRGSELGL